MDPYFLHIVWNINGTYEIGLLGGRKEKLYVINNLGLTGILSPPPPPLPFHTAGFAMPFCPCSLTQRGNIGGKGKTFMLLCSQWEN